MSSLRRSPRLAGKAPQNAEHPWPRQRRVQFEEDECPVSYDVSHSARVATWFCPAFTALMMVAAFIAGPKVTGADILYR